MNRERTPQFHFLTLFPELIKTWFEQGILSKALKEQIFEIHVHQLRDFSRNARRTVDDVAYGGGGGMVLKLEPLVEAVETIKRTSDPMKVIYLSPAGKPIHQLLVDRLAKETEHFNFLLVCGRYEGVDQRFLDRWVDEEVSLGDFVLTGGELPAIALIDPILRKLNGVLGNANSALHDSFSLKNEGQRLLEYPHYTRPKDFRGLAVPQVLLSGNHSDVAKWRHEQSLKRTKNRRPDLY